MGILWEIFLALAGGWLIFTLTGVLRLFWAGRIRESGQNRRIGRAEQSGRGTGRGPAGRALCKLYVLMGAQEDAAEGFIRKLIAWRNRLWPRLEVAVVDCGAGGDTGRIIRLLAGDLDYPVIEDGFYGERPGERPGERAAGMDVAASAAGAVATTSAAGATAETTATAAAGEPGATAATGATHATAAPHATAAAAAAGTPFAAGTPYATGSGEAFLYYDARRHKGKELLRAPLFYFLKREIAAD